MDCELVFFVQIKRLAFEAEAIFGNYHFEFVACPLLDQALVTFALCSSEIIDVLHDVYMRYTC